MLVRCPNCGRKFDTLYARAYSCKSCNLLTITGSCNYIKCPFCGYEFTI
ncbi:MAG: hypothetical protein LM560_00800 [Desulfurococcaceae archaeon]|nr:hypothetical protein [Desulfurococcaceae archaeon]